MQRTNTPASVNPPAPYIRAELEIIAFEENVISTSGCPCNLAQTICACDNGDCPCDGGHVVCCDTGDVAPCHCDFADLCMCVGYSF